MSDELELAMQRIAAVRMTLVWAARRRADGRIQAYAAKYAPILAKLSETEFFGLIEAISSEGNARTAAGGREARLFSENEHPVSGVSVVLPDQPER